MFQYLPSFGVIFTQALTEVLVPTGVDALLVVLVHVHLLRILLEVGDIMCCVSALQNRVCCLRLLLALPEEVLAKTDSQFCCEHISTSSAR